MQGFLYSQVTIGTVEKKKQEEKIVLKPPPYDSLKNIEYQNEPINYYQYVGLKLYTFPISNPIIGKYEGDRKNFLFSISPTIIKAKVKTEYYPFNYDYAHAYSAGLVTSYDSVITFIYKPIHYYSGGSSNEPFVGIFSDSASVSGKYFTILDIYYGKKVDSIINQIKIKIENLKNWGMHKTCFSQLPQNFQAHNGNNIERPLLENNPLFLLRNDENGDSLLCSNPFQERMILVPYFVKHKQLYQYLNFINLSDKSKWVCSEVTLLKRNPEYPNMKDNKYYFFYKFKNEKDEQTEYVSDGSYMLESEYIKNEQEKKLKQEELIAKQQKEEKSRIENEKKVMEKYKTECIAKYGQHFGELVAQGKLEIGMTTEMCESAWGIPWNIYKTTTVLGTREHWFYTWKYNLYFFGGILTKIEN